MTWKEYLKAVSEEDISDWEVALKAFTKKGKELGIPLSVIELLKKAYEDAPHPASAGTTDIAPSIEVISGTKTTFKRGPYNTAEEADKHISDNNLPNELSGESPRYAPRLGMMENIGLI